MGKEKAINKYITLIACLTFLLSMLGLNPAHAKILHKEKYYQEQSCSKLGGVIEFRLEDSTRVDCLNGEYAIEYDFANKWAEAIGQSLHYARKTGRKAGIMLIIEREKDLKYYYRLMDNIEYYFLPIEVWKTGEPSYE